MNSTRSQTEAAKSGTGPKLTRKRMLTILAEIVQELCQPLSVINCALGTIGGGHLGDVTTAQADMLQLAGEGAAKIEVLIDNLRNISGLPDTL